MTGGPQLALLLNQEHKHVRKILRFLREFRLKAEAGVRAEQRQDSMTSWSLWYLFLLPVACQGSRNVLGLQPQQHRAEYLVCGDGPSGRVDDNDMFGGRQISLSGSGFLQEGGKGTGS